MKKTLVLLAFSLTFIASFATAPFIGPLLNQSAAPSEKPIKRVFTEGCNGQYAVASQHDMGDHILIVCVCTSECTACPSVTSLPWGDAGDNVYAGIMFDFVDAEIANGNNSGSDQQQFWVSGESQPRIFYVSWALNTTTSNYEATVIRTQ